MTRTTVRSSSPSNSPVAGNPLGHDAIRVAPTDTQTDGHLPRPKAQSTAAMKGAGSVWAGLPPGTIRRAGDSAGGPHQRWPFHEILYVFTGARRARNKEGPSFPTGLSPDASNCPGQDKIVLLYYIVLISFRSRALSRSFSSQTSRRQVGTYSTHARSTAVSIGLNTHIRHILGFDPNSEIGNNKLTGSVYLPPPVGLPAVGRLSALTSE